MNAEIYEKFCNCLEWYKLINNHWDDPSLVLYVCFRHLALSYALATTGAVGTALTINNMVKVGIINTSDTYSERALLADFKTMLLFFRTFFIWQPMVKHHMYRHFCNTLLKKWFPISTSLYCQKFPPLIGRFVPFTAVAAANCINIPCMRSR